VAAAVLVGLIGWRLAVLGSGGGLVDWGRLVRPLPIAGCVATVVVAAGLWWLWRGVCWRLGVLLATPAALLAAGLWVSLPATPHGTHLRLLYVLILGVGLMLGDTLSSMSRWRPGWCAGGQVVVALAVVSAGLGSHLRLDGWLRSTAASQRLVEAVVETLDHGPEPTGARWVFAPGDEIALDPAVKLRRPRWGRDLVLLRPTGVSFLTVSPRLLPVVQRELWLWEVAGNPAWVGEWVAVVGFARGDRVQAALRGSSEVLVLSPGGL
jgi:hypothetical protein